MSFIRLSREPGIHYLAAHTFLEASPTFDHVLEAQCAIQSITHGRTSVAPLNVPLADFATYPIGSVFGSEMAKVKRLGTRRQSTRKILLDGGFEHWEADRSVELTARTLTGRWALQLPSATPVLINHDQGRHRLGVAHGEQFRFVCASMSLLLDAITLASFSEQDDISGIFVNIEETGVEGDGTLVLTPKRAYQNVTATLQLALRHTEPALARYLQGMFLDARLRIAAGEVAMPGRRSLDEPNLYTIESETLDVLREDGRRERVELCDRIVQDLREPKFKEIVVRTRISRADELLEILDELTTPEERERQRVNSSTKMIRYPQSSTTPVRLGRLRSEFGLLFPAFRNLKVRFDREYVKSSKPRTAHNGKFKDVAAKFATVTPGGDKSGLPYVRTGPTETRVFKRPSLPERFLAASDEPGLTPVVVDLDLKCPYMRAFLEASCYLYDEIAHHLLPPVELARREQLLFELPAVWGGVAVRSRGGQPRRIAAFPLEYDNRLVWVIEFERQGREQISMGVCAPIEYDDGLSFLGRVMKSVCARIGHKRDGDIYGTFPRADFDDVRIETIRHSEARWDGETLHEVIRSRAAHLLAPLRSF